MALSIPIRESAAGEGGRSRRIDCDSRLIDRTRPWSREGGGKGLSKGAGKAKRKRWTRPSRSGRNDAIVVIVVVFSDGSSRETRPWYRSRSGRKGARLKEAGEPKRKRWTALSRSGWRWLVAGDASLVSDSAAGERRVSGRRKKRETLEGRKAKTNSILKGSRVVAVVARDGSSREARPWYRRRS